MIRDPRLYKPKSVILAKSTFFLGYVDSTGTGVFLNIPLYVEQNITKKAQKKKSEIRVTFLILTGFKTSQ